MNRTEAESLVIKWDTEALRRGRHDARKHLWRILDCLAGWRRYDAGVAAALDELQQTPDVLTIRAICEKIVPDNGFKD